MKKLLFTLLVVALAAPLAAAEAPSAIASEPSSSVVSAAATNDAPGLDVGALSPEEFMALLQAKGLGVPKPVTATPPPCPVSVACVSSTGGVCAVSLNCTFTNLGPCCSDGSGEHLCCLKGDIVVKTCRCLGSGCPMKEVSFSCV